MPREDSGSARRLVRPLHAVKLRTATPGIDPRTPAGPCTAWPLSLDALVERAGAARRAARWNEATAVASLGLCESVARDRPDDTIEFLNNLGAAAFEQGEVRAAERHFSRARAVAEHTGDDGSTAAALVNLGAIANLRGRYEVALMRYRAGQNAYRRAGDRIGEARALNNLGMVFGDLERWSAAARAYRMARGLAADEGDDALVGLIALNATEVHLADDRLDEARRSCDEALERSATAGDTLSTAEAYRFYGQIHLRSGRESLAEDHFRNAARRGRELGAPLTEAEALRELGMLHLSKGRHNGALESLSRSLTLFRGLEAERDLDDVRERIGDLEDLIVRLVERLGREVEEVGGAYLYGHSARVAEYAVAIACDLGFDADQMKGILVAGYLHDIGKLRIDRALLHKPGRFTEEERRQMNLHPVYSVEYLREFDLPWNVEPIVRHHHERYDGTGYPDGLYGDEIPLGARILLVADVFDALTTARPYREPWSREKALAYLEVGAGAMGDPEITRVFLDVARRESFGPDTSEEAPFDEGMRPEELAEAFASLSDAERERLEHDIDLI